MNPIIAEVVEYLEGYDCASTKENIKRMLKKWIENLYSHIGIEAHKHSEVCGAVNETGMSLEELDEQMFQQIEEYRKCLIELG